jgi:hypothetical protein
MPQAWGKRHYREDRFPSNKVGSVELLQACSPAEAVQFNSSSVCRVTIDMRQQFADSDLH